MVVNLEGRCSLVLPISPGMDSSVTQKLQSSRSVHEKRRVSTQSHSILDPTGTEKAQPEL